MNTIELFLTTVMDTRTLQCPNAVHSLVLVTLPLSLGTRPYYTHHWDLLSRLSACHLHH